MANAMALEELLLYISQQQAFKLPINELRPAAAAANVADQNQFRTIN